MKKQEILIHIKKWDERMRSLESQLSTVAIIFGSAEDNSPFIKEIARMQEEYTYTLELLLGCKTEWLRVWWLEWGMHGIQLTVEVDGVEFPAKTLEDLATIIEADR